MKIAAVILGLIFGLFVMLEVGLRVFLGLGNPLIYLAHEQIGYLLAPNQRVRRFGKLIAINEYSMRSSPVEIPRSHDELRILLLGDSVANGGWWTDQSETISTLMARSLSPILASRGFPQVAVLNASANSWGPRNELAYLQQFGLFEAQVLVLLINTDDLFATQPSSVLVGRDRNYPNHKPVLALIEAFNRYLFPAPEIPADLKASQAESGDRVGKNLAAIQEIQAIAQQKNAYFLLAMTPLRRELGLSGPRDYEQKARERLLKFTQSQQIHYLDFLPIFNTVELPETLYRDSIHLSPTGNALVSESNSRLMIEILDKIDKNLELNDSN